MRPLSECHLYAFVDTAYLHGRAPADVARQLCEGGADIIQLRAKRSSPAEVRWMAESILPVTRSAEVALVINDHREIAREIGAEICHLGQEDFFAAGHRTVAEARGINSEVQIGLSTHAPEQCARAVAAGADYVAIGPVFATDTKPGVQPVTLEYVRWAAANVKIPWFAIGGINFHTIHQVIAAGAERICVVSAILNAPDLVTACRRFRRQLARAS